MGKKVVIGIIIAAFAVTIFYMLTAWGIIKFETVEDDMEKEPDFLVTAENLEDGCYYVWHDSVNSLEQDLAGISNLSVFNLCPSGLINWKKQKYIKHTIWFSSSEDDSIPTLYPGDKLVYVSSYSVPFEGIKWERYADYGYTIGVANLINDEGGHYRIPYDSDKGFEGYINPESDASKMGKFFSDLKQDAFLGQIGTSNVKDNNILISDGGTVLNLDKNGKYACIFYRGSLSNPFQMTADQHTFGYLEEFVTYDFDFVNNGDLYDQHSCIVINIPEWFKTGYYYIEGTGMFRYVAQKDVGKYNGLSYDPSVDWNDPIILYADNGLQIYNPSTGLDQTDILTDSSHSNTVYNENYRENNGVSDPGPEYYEEFSDEYLVE